METLRIVIRVARPAGKGDFTRTSWRAEGAEPRRRARAGAVLLAIAIAKNVLTFDLAADGTVVCSDGAAIRIIGPDGQSERALKSEWIKQVLAL